MSNRDMTQHYTPDPEIGLFGGRWMLDPTTRVVRWVQEREPKTVTAGPLPKVIKCGWCATDFIRTRTRIRYCSDTCKHEGRKKMHREFENERRKHRKSCTECGAQIVSRRARKCKECALSARDVEGKWATTTTRSEAA